MYSDIRPVYSALYCAGPTARRCSAKEILKMLRKEVIETANTELASLIVFEPKKDGSLKFCVDYCKLNAVTVKNSYPLSRTEEYNDSLGEAKIFSTLESNSGYWKIEIDKRDWSKTAFTSHHGPFQFMRIPLGFKNALATFRRAMEVIFSSAKWQSALMYLDDIVVFSKNAHNHMAHLRQALTLYRKAGVTLKLNTCSFFDEKIKYIRQIIRPRRLKLSEATTAVVRKLKDSRLRRNWDSSRAFVTC